MDWLNHPAYTVVRNRIISRFRKKIYVFQKLSPMVLLCGATDTLRRETILNYLRKKRPDAFVFKADDVWFEIASETAANALHMEEQLADLSDLVIVLVESPGTFTELGAFSFSERLRKKLLPILEIERKHEHSFINTGPVRWVDADSEYAPSIRADFSIILECANDLEDRMRRLPRFPIRVATAEELLQSPRHLLFLLFDVIAVTGPVTFQHVIYYIVGILGGRPPNMDLGTLLGLAVSLGRVRRIPIEGRDPVYMSSSALEYHRPSFAERRFSLTEERARVLEVLQRIPDARSVLEKASKVASNAR